MTSSVQEERMCCLDSNLDPRETYKCQWRRHLVLDPRETKDGIVSEEDIQFGSVLSLILPGFPAVLPCNVWRRVWPGEVTLDNIVMMIYIASITYTVATKMF